MAFDPFSAALSGGSALAGLLSKLFGGGNDGSEAIKDAANIQANAARYAADLAMKQFQATRGDLTPWRTGGKNAYMTYLDLLNIPRPTALDLNRVYWGDPSPQDMDQYNKNVAQIKQYFDTGIEPQWNSSFNAGAIQQLRDDYAAANQPKIDPTQFLEATPGYQFRMSEGMNALNRSAAAKGMALSGANIKGALQFGQGLASDEYNALLNRIAGVQQQGQNAAVQTGTFGQNAANTAGQATMAGAQAQAQGIYNALNQRNSSYGDTMNWAGYAAGQLPNLFRNISWPSSSINYPWSSISPSID